jgi:hypothetical protein
MRKMISGNDLMSDVIKKSVIRNGEGNSMIIHASFDLIENPHPFLENLPYGAEMKKSRKKTSIAKLKIRIIEYLYSKFMYIYRLSYFLFLISYFLFYPPQAPTR